MIPISVIHFIENFSKNKVAPFYRALGQKMMKRGLEYQGSWASDDRLVPSLRCLKYSGVHPQLSMTNFVAPNATIFGDVKCRMGSSIWYGATLRVEGGSIDLGKNAVVHDNAIIASNSSKTPVKIGHNAWIGSNSLIEDSEIGDGAVVGMASTIPKDCVLEHNSVLAPGSSLEQGTRVKSRELWGGSPAVLIRLLSSEELDTIKEHIVTLKDLASIHSEETEKDLRTIINETDKQYDKYASDEPETEVIDDLIEAGMPVFTDDFEHAEDRLQFDFYKKDNDYNIEEFYDTYHNVDEHFPDRFSLL